MGLPIGLSLHLPLSFPHLSTPPSSGKLICATNKNDIVHRTLSSGDMSLGQNHPTLSPAMDIQFAYNLERLLYFISDGNVKLVQTFMRPLETQLSQQSSDLPFQSDKKEECVKECESVSEQQLLPQEVLEKIQLIFDSISVSDENTLVMIREVWEKYQYPLCPHSAVGVYAAMKIFPHLWSVASNASGGTPMVCVLTAHPSKFPDVFERATGEMTTPELSCFPVSELKELPTRYEWLRQYDEEHQLIQNWREVWIGTIKEKISGLV
jgi:threonine synthase